MLFYVAVFLIVSNMTTPISCKRFMENKLLTYLLVFTFKIQTEDKDLYVCL